jgi:2-methylfumaryl-CoA isomerase
VCSSDLCGTKMLAEIDAAFAGSGVLWGPFQDFVELVRNDPRCSPANPLFAEIEQPGIGHYPMPGLPLDFGAAPRQPTRPAPRLGEHTDMVLAQVLGLAAAEIGRLHDAGIVAAPD